MPAEVTRSEFQHLADRVAVLESEVEGEKVVSRYILEQTRRNGDDLAALRTRMDRVEARLDRIEERLDRLEGEMRQLRDELRLQQRNLPGMIAETLREVLREQHGG
jgi:tetrahydromethanopterin S-methyltransferase subunit G